MNQSERRKFLIDRLLSEQPQYRQIQIPANMQEQRTLLRALMQTVHDVDAIFRVLDQA